MVIGADPVFYTQQSPPAIYRPSYGISHHGHNHIYFSFYATGERERGERVGTRLLEIVFVSWYCMMPCCLIGAGSIGPRGRHTEVSKQNVTYTTIYNQILFSLN